MKSLYPGVYLLFLLFALACSSSKKGLSDGGESAPASSPDSAAMAPLAGEDREPTLEMEFRELDTLFVSAPAAGKTKDKEYTLPPYNPSPTRTHDLLHTKLDLRFNWEEEAVLGLATLKLKPYFFPTDELVLDARGFDIHDLRLEKARDTLAYRYDNRRLTIQLPRTYQADETFTLVIDYTARPRSTGGSLAITDNKGLYFINPRGETPDKPRQIWTQGETEWNSRWFPTIDKPNERCTQEMLLTVDTQYTTLSNGALLSSTVHDDGTRTDYWKMDQPHAPYLFMIAIGDFAVVQDEWKDRPVNYYVEPEYRQHARAIFGGTLEMLDFFSGKLGVEYPWPKYSQVVVRDYVSGAMENTTAVIYGDFVQRTTRELIDDTENERIIAHELSHHWFGNLVTCESWANLAMNEGFANYSEYLWFEHKYGRDAADHHLLGERSGYFSQARGNAHPLIHFGYGDKEDMFDAHSYNKGGAILHMLRRYVGDEAFFAALNHYLTANAYTAVEAHDLRLAFETVTGEDLNWFFNQWFFEPGHPKLEVSHQYVDSTQSVQLSVRQVQEPERTPAVFRLPVAVDIYTAAGQAPLRRDIVIDQREQTFSFKLPAPPRLLNFDAESALLAEISMDKTPEQLRFQYENAPHLPERYQAIQELKRAEGESNQQLLREALDDPFWVIRALALQNVRLQDDAEVQKRVRNMAATDSHARVRASALLRLSEVGNAEAVTEAKRAIDQDSAYNVISAALDLLRQTDTTLALEYAKKLENIENADILEAIGQLYLETNDPEYLSFFEAHFDEMSGFNALAFTGDYQLLAMRNGKAELIDRMIRSLQEIARNGRSSWLRLGATKALNDARNDLRAQANELEEDNPRKSKLETTVERITQIMESIKKEEKNPRLRELYEQFQLVKRT